MKKLLVLISVLATLGMLALAGGSARADGPGSQTNCGDNFSEQYPILTVGPPVFHKGDGTWDTEVEHTCDQGYVFMVERQKLVSGTWVDIGSPAHTFDISTCQSGDCFRINDNIGPTGCQHNAWYRFKAWDDPAMGFGPDTSTQVQPC